VDWRQPFGGRREAARPAEVGPGDEPDPQSPGSTRGPIRPDLPAWRCRPARRIIPCAP